MSLCFHSFSPYYVQECFWLQVTETPGLNGLKQRKSYLYQTTGSPKVELAQDAVSSVVEQWHEEPKACSVLLLCPQDQLHYGVAEVAPGNGNCIFNKGERVRETEKQTQSELP